MGRLKKNMEKQSRLNNKMKKYKYPKRTNEQQKALNEFFNMTPSNPKFTNAKVNFIKKYGMSPRYMMTMTK